MFFIDYSIERLVCALLNVEMKDLDEIKTVGNCIYVTLKRKDVICPKCDKRMLLNGYFKRKVKVSNRSFEGIDVYLKARRYRCNMCGTNSSDIAHMAPANKTVSYSLITEIMNLLKSPKTTFLEVSRITGIPLSTVIRTFDNNCHIPRKKLPEVLCIDEVYTKNSSYDSKYSCILYDFKAHNLVDVLPSRKKNYLQYYMDHIPLEERNAVTYVCIDMYDTYRSIVKHYMKKAILCVDSFHVVKHLNDDLKSVRIRIQKRYDTSSLEYYLLKNFGFLLLNRSINFYGKKKFNKRLNDYFNYGEILDLILAIDEDILKAYCLKEEYIDFNATCDILKAEQVFDTILNDFIEANIKEYEEFITLLTNWKSEIINSFHTVDERRISNGIAESLNQDIAAIIYNSKGIHNHERRRKRIMYSINKDGFNLK